MSDGNHAIGEVIASSTVSFVAQSYQLHEAPAFGSLVVTCAPDATRHYGLCYGSETGSIEPGRHPIAWGSVEDADGDMYAQQPQLAHVLRTTFSCVLVGSSKEEDTAPLQRIPSHPPRVHERVWQASDVIVRHFFTNLTCLRFLLRANLTHTEDLLAATIIHAWRAHHCDRTFLITAGRAAASLLAGDYEKLTAIVELLAVATEG